MKTTKFALLAVSALALAACGSSTKVTDSVDLSKGAARVYYSYDSSAISEDARTNLLGQSLYLKNHKDVKVQVAGNCDERGTVDYNLALGQRRANAAKAVLVKDGVDASRISTISYGKERPAVAGSGENVWQWNRNATTTIK